MDREEDYGLIRPSLIKQLRSILDQYPDDGQILKELIQNAEDAGAQKIQFLYDATQHGTRKLYHPDMAQFQGPALYTYNDALFEEKDWTGIRMLQDSVKEHEPMKVGRFGLGFKSVLHMTDLPCVLSGERLVMLDPHERYFTYQDSPTTGYSWHLGQRRAEIAAAPDTFSPFRAGICGATEDTFRRAHFHGTLFRFPLRQTPSPLSDTVYTGDRIGELFRNFEADAHLVVIFLKNLESVELLRRDNGEQDPRIEFRAHVSEVCVEYARAQRRAFRSKIRPEIWMPEPVSVTYPLVIATTRFHYHPDGTEARVEKKLYKYLVNEYYAGGEGASIHLRSLQKDPSLGYVPITGTAMPLGESETKPEAKTETDTKTETKTETETKTKTKTGPDEESEAPGGQIFCFLPLPTEEKSPTGLPVHVNGYFSVSQNRRHLKWPSAGQNVKTDRALLWNECLLQEVVPRSYSQLIVQAIAMNERTNGRVVRVADVYAALPDVTVVGERWRPVLQPLFSTLFRSKLFHSAAAGVGWCSLQQAVFDCVRETPQIRETVIQVLLSAGVSVVSCPRHLLHALGIHSTQTPHVVAPSTLRTALSRHPRAYQPLSRAAKLHLLAYAIKDEEWAEMTGLQLLPVEDETFVAFEKRGSPLFIPRDDVPATLLAGQKALLLAQDLPDQTLHKLKHLADEGTSRLYHLTPDNFLRLLPNILPRTWVGAPGPVVWASEADLPWGWLEAVWTFLRRHYPSDLSRVRGLPLIPTNPEPPYGAMLEVRESPVCVLKSAMGGMLPEKVGEVLVAMGAAVVEELPVFVRSHGAVVGAAVRLPFAEDVAELLGVLVRTAPGCTEALRDPERGEARAEMVELLSSLSPKRVNVQLMKILKTLPLFNTRVVVTSDGEEKSEVVSVSEVNKAVPRNSIAVDLNQRYLDLPTDAAVTLARNLGVTFVDVSTLLRTSILPDIRHHRLPAEKVQEVMTQVLQNIHSYAKEDPTIFKHLHSVPFVTIEKGNPRCPEELYDPEVSELRHIFHGEAVFPVGDYTQPDTLMLLRKMGLRGRDSISGKDILYSAISVEQSSESDVKEETMNKAKAIVQHLSNHWAMLLEEVNGSLLAQWLKTIQWVPVMITKPSGFPQQLPWFGTCAFAKPEDMKTVQWAPIIGSVMPIVQSPVCVDMCEIFGWNGAPPMSAVVSHLASLVAAYTSQDKATCLSLVISIYDYFSKCDSTMVRDELRKQGLVAWIWTGDGFASVEQVTIQQTFTHLQPYVYALPSEMLPFVGLLRKMGVAERCTSSSLIGILSHIKQRHEEEAPPDQEQTQRDLQLSIDILNHICKLSLDDTEAIIMPAQSPEDDQQLRMFPIADLTYCDVEWLRQGFDLMEFDEQDGITFIHPNVPVATAEALGVPTLMSRMLHAEQLDITGFGQTEPLTTRLHRLLEDYTDGLAIPKELIQNADDAGATIVRFLYDERTNADAMKYLIDEGMRECQGPALWAYNNAVFSDSDFENITKLGGATKEDEIDKIGKFGLGFNAVYNITDVPSFISRNNIVVFDPHTTHLGRGIKDRSKPGIKIDMKRNKTLLRKLPDQFQPYNGVFGCDVSAETQGFYDGTLFRLPLRTRSQAGKSEISKLHYDQRQVLQLLQMLVKNAHSLLLFTQNVIRVEIHHLQDGDMPDQATELFSVVKEPIRIIRPLKCGVKPNTKAPDEETQAMIQNSNVLKASSHYLRAMAKQKRSRTMAVLEIPQATTCIRTNPSLSANGKSMLEVQQNLSPLSWITSSCMGQEASLSLSKGDKRRAGYVPVAGVATLIEEKDGGFIPINMLHTNVRAQVFCYLPLPVATGLPIHINASFAMQSSRRNLSEKTDDDKHNDKFEWNLSLLQDAVVHAYVQMLHDSQKILPKGVPVKYFDLWPLTAEVGGYFRPFVQSFYESLGTLMKVPVFYNGSEVVTLNNAVFLDPLMSKTKHAGECATKVFGKYKEGLNVVCISDSALRALRSAGCSSIIEEKTYSAHRFFTEVFFPNIAEMDADIRDPLVSFALLQNDTKLDELVKTYECIPVSPEGEMLRTPEQLVHPTSLASRLFTPEDQRFPFGVLAEGKNLMALQKLGMTVNEVDWEDILERAGTVQHLLEEDTELGLARHQHILSFIERKLLLVSSSGAKNENLEEIAADLSSIPFLLPLAKPDNFPLKWKSDELCSDSVLAADEAYTKDMRYLVSATQPILREEGLTLRIKSFLGLSSKKPKVEQVMTQMEHALSLNPKELDAKQMDELERICSAVYTALQDFCAKDEELARTVEIVFKDRECILTSGGFQQGSKVAFQFPYDCSPYMYAVPADYTRRLRPLMQRLGVREQFEVVDYMTALQSMHEEYSGHGLKDRPLDVATRMVTLLNNCMKVKGISSEEVEAKYGPIYVPNASGTLQSASTLCFNDCQWISSTQSMNFTHPDITFNTAASLGVKTKRQEALSKHAQGIPFGQKERLTNSLRRILNTYPLDHEIFKELIQNADDAGATQIHFVVDPRQHSTRHVFEESWKHLQGPSLCVYNNKPFTRADLDGIQRLGEGSKNQDPSKTGQYGIGFSSVYHLTDCPAILTHGSDLGKTLCVFDPHCRFVPGATNAEPGMQYTDIENLEQAFPDVFSCFPSKYFNMDGATMFRFPLRGREMAEMSQISKTQITTSKIQSLLGVLKNELFDILLFTNTLRQVSISEIDTVSGELKNTYTVKAMTSHKASEQRKQFFEDIKKSAAALKSGDLELTAIPRQDVTYSIVVNDNAGHQEKWSVVQRVGLEEDTPVPDSILHAFKYGDLALMPRGGAACLVEKRAQGQVDRTETKKKVFCILPLPLTTNLPVHINGHFALGYENRRGLWTDGNSCAYKKDWNDLLCERVIAAAYCKLLEMIRMEGVPCEMNENVARVTCSRQMLDSALKTHQSVFPQFDDMHTDWDVLVKGVYQHIAESNANVLPSIRELSHEVSTGDNPAVSKQWQVMWLPPKGEGSTKAFFSTLDKPEEEKSDGSLFGKVRGWFKQAPQTPQKTDAQILKEVLLDCGFKLLEASAVIAENFRRCGIEIDFMSADGVILFFRSYSSEKPICDIGPLPAKLDTTPFKDYKTLKIVLDYCKADPGFLYKIDGAPLLLTNDGALTVFEAASPVFYSKYTDLVPKCASKFLHLKMLGDVFGDPSAKEAIVFQDFTITDLASLIGFAMPEQFHYQEKVEYEKGLGYIPSGIWLKRLWTYLMEQLHDVVMSKDLTDHEKTTIVVEQLQPLMDWCLVPTEIGRRPYLVSLRHANSILSLHKIDYEYYPLKEIFVKMQVWELDYNALNTSESFNYDLVKLLVSSLQTPHSILYIVWKAVVGEGTTAAHFRKDECLKLLGYFCKHLPQLRALSRSKSEKFLVEKTEARAAADLPAAAASPAPAPAPGPPPAYAAAPPAVALMGSGSSMPDHKEQGQARNMPREAEAMQCSAPEDPKPPDEQNIEYLRDLPFYATIYGDMIKLTDCLVYTLPSRIPTNGIEIWQSKSGTVFLERKEPLQELYNFIDCASISVLFVYCKFIFQQFEYMPPEDRIVHLHHVYKCYLKNDGTQESLSQDDQATLLDCLRSLEFLENKDGELCAASEFYDRENVVFNIMLTADKFPPPAPRLFKQSEWTSFLTKIGLKTEVSREQFLEFASKVAEEGKKDTGAGAIMKSKVLVEHMYQMEDSHLQEVMASILSVKFLAPQPVSADLQRISPQYGDSGSGQMPSICFNDSVPGTYEKVVWTSAHLLPSWANPNTLHHLSATQKEEALESLGIQKVPRIELVMAHFKNLCALHPQHKTERAFGNVFKAIFHHLQTYAMDDAEVLQELSRMPCIPVEDGQVLVKPTQTVFSLYKEEEIKPYLYKVPVHFGEFQTLFKRIGVSDQATADQFAEVLSSIQKLSGWGSLTPNELRQTFKATKGVFDSVKRGPRMSTTSTLFLPSEKGELIDANRLIYNDSPSFYDRVREFGLHFLMDLKECGIQSSHMEEEIKALPTSMRPVLLSTLVQEVLVASGGESEGGVAEHLNQRIKSEEFLRAVARLIRHELHARGENVNDTHMFTVMDRLSVIQFHAVPEVKTRLLFKKKPIANSEVTKHCFVDKQSSVMGDIYKVYIKHGAALNQELLIPVAEIINKILSGMLRNSVLYLLPVLSCKAGQVQAKLNQLNVRLDHSEAVTTATAMPKLGDLIPEHHQKLLKWGSTRFETGEYVGFKESVDGKLFYAQIAEEVMSPEDDKVYLVNVGNGRDAVIAQGLQIYKFAR